MAVVPVVNDVYELVDEQEFQGQKCLNVYFYKLGTVFATTFPTFAQVLVDNWIDQILPDITPVQNEAVVHKQVRARNLFDGSDAFSRDITVFNEDSGPGDVLPVFTTFPFQLNGDTHAVRNGAKRLAGVTEAIQTDGIVTDAGTLTLLGDTADAMARAVQVGTIIMDDAWFPCLVKRVRSGTPGAYEYELPDTRGTEIVSNIIVTLFDVLLSSQVSRKIGRGA